MSVVSLVDQSAYMVRDWATAGMTCFVLDIENKEKKKIFSSGGSITWLNWNEDLLALCLWPISLLSKKVKIVKNKEK